MKNATTVMCLSTTANETDNLTVAGVYGMYDTCNYGDMKFHTTGSTL